ncbi:T9SS type A sorting domain-containing protein [Paracrocinitomix mangrovi]|uniref:M1 family aminopeptidase n=1 Tax=Paracrocinitomix mangrovi TaxID=2862509 RepID=UPI001C8E006C|nr:M1 family aminopeptidase [Paracrocinitomix mangrovi]UKN01252.1 T9SS type A sorting domain-containing protein [Paracrocinitomix mangrovi]
MKLLLSIFTIAIGITSFSQVGCQMQHAILDDFSHLYKSGNESLRSDTVDVINYSLYLDFTQGQSGQMSGACEVKFSPKMAISSLSLDLQALTVDSITFQGSSISFSHDDTLIVAQLGTTLNSGQTDSLTVYYHGSPQMDPSGWGGFYMNTQYFYNLGVGFASIPHNFGRAWHPCFDNFVERATYDFEVLTANNFTAYCNGTRTSVQNVGTDSLLTTWVMSTEIPSYLASVAISSYTHVTDNYHSNLQNSDIPIWLAANPSDTTNLKNSFANLDNALTAFEEAYGPYVWERIGYVLVPFNSGAMEHATNIAYPLATANGNLTYETLMAHELSHHWWGDWVTCKTAEEMWINEGMAVYSEHLFTEYVYGSSAYLSAVKQNHKSVLHLAHINDSGYYALNAVPLKYTYGDHSYKKGADVMHTLRGYMGDAEFMAGLKAVQVAFGGGNASSEDFRDELNNQGGVDVTDFFNDWIFQSGFSQFSITNSTVTDNGSDYTLSLVIDQKLKGAANHHNNVPMQLTVMDANWNEYSVDLNLGGDYQTVDITIPFSPAFMALNMDDRINQAVTGQNQVIKTNGIKLLSYANSRLDVNSVTDSAFVRIEHHWVYPDNMTNLQNVMLSPDRYWHVHGLDLENLNGTIRFEYNGSTTNSGHLDNGLLQDTGNQSFTEDSLVLLYRPDAQSLWEIHSDYALNTMGSTTDKSGFITAQGINQGQYCFGYRVHTVNIEEGGSKDETFRIFPNPADDTVYIDLSHWSNDNYTATLYEINGKQVLQKSVNGGEINHLNTQHIVAGSYILIITDQSQNSVTSKRIVIN